MLCDKQPPSVKDMLMDIKVLATGKTTHVLAACIGGGMGMTNTLMSQLNQMMCSRNYSVAQSSLAAILNVLIGLIGGFTLGPLARKHGLQVEFGKCGTVITCAFMIALAMCLRESGVYPGIVIFLSLYGLFGIAAYPMNLELMTETTYPMDPIMGECWVHTHAQVIVLDNNRSDLLLTWIWIRS